MSAVKANVVYIYSAGSAQTTIEASLHPPHLIDSSGSLTPSALIPFCSYQTDMSLLVQTSTDLPFPICSQFRPTALEGQLCYSLNVSALNPPKSKVGFNNGLFLILDEGTLRSSAFAQPRQLRKPSNILSLQLKDSDAHKRSVRIYLNTLASFTDYRNGSYSMNVLKKMTGTRKFMDLPDKEKYCSVEPFEQCQIHQYFNKVQSSCGCVPWALSNLQNIEVNLMRFPI